MNMAKYKKKPVEIEAFQYMGDLKDRYGGWLAPSWAVKALKDGVMYYDGPELYIKTLEGDHHVSVNDYIIQGVHGELYPCKPDIFSETYSSAKNDITEAKAADLLRYIEDYTDDKKMLQAAELAVKALEHQVPAKPIMKETRDGKIADFYCLTCKRLMGWSAGIPKELRFCSGCGQRIDWSDYERED